jgi:hypothetical protein
MNKRWLVLVWILGFALPLAAQEGVRLISNMGLIDSGANLRLSPPNTLVVGIDVNMDVLFKLSDDTGVIKGGQFLKGFNSFSLDVQDRFGRSGTYPYTLELKAGAHIVRKKFKIDIRIDLPQESEQQQSETQAESEHVVSLYVDGQLVVSYRKLYTEELSKEIAAIPRPYKINPYESAAEPQPDAGVSILSAAAAAYQVIKGLLGKKKPDKPTRPVDLKTQISTRWLRLSSSGEERTLAAVISLWIED